MAFFEPYKSHHLWKARVETENATLDSNPLDKIKSAGKLDEDRFTQHLEKSLTMSQRTFLRQAPPTPAKPELPGPGEDVVPSACFSIPRRGESVQLTGMRNRPYLNGAKGEIVGPGADEQGFLMVRLEHPGGAAGDDLPRMMKVRPHRLKPLRNNSLGAFGPTTHARFGPATNAANTRHHRAGLGWRIGSSSGLVVPAEDGWESAVSCSTRASSAGLSEVPLRRSRSASFSSTYDDHFCFGQTYRGGAASMASTFSGASGKSEKSETSRRSAEKADPKLFGRRTSGYLLTGQSPWHFPTSVVL